MGCPVCYILASLANKTSQVDVEQILGRILRQPYAKQHSAPLLNTSYVLTCSNDFHNTLENIVKGLNKAGFSRKDYRIGDNVTQPVTPANEPEYVQAELQVEPETTNISRDTFDDIVAVEVKTALEESSPSENETVVSMEEEAKQAAHTYETELENNDNNGFMGGELGDILNQNEMQSQYKEEAQSLRIPQFFLQSVPDLFGDAYELLEPEHLSEGFTLSGQDAQISFELATGEMYRVVFKNKEKLFRSIMRASRVRVNISENILPNCRRKRKSVIVLDMICHQINKNNRYATSEIEDYVRRIVGNMTEDELAAMETAVPVYARKIQQKIEALENDHREKQFYKWLDSGKVLCRDYYNLPAVITPAYTTDAIPYSLYEAERDDMNNFEHNLIDVVVGLDNIKWWHRIIERKGFRLNAFINHYPDFMVMTKSGKLVLIEAKGDYLDGDDSKTKLKLGRHWQAQAGRMYRYFMVFKDKELGIDGAYTLDKFVDVMKSL